MAAYLVRYRFAQHFKVPPKEAFEWCVDYSPMDHKLMGEDGKRKVSKIAKNTFVLDDSFSGGKASKKKTVNIYPERMFWVSTHTSGPSKYSQFLYEITPDGKNGSKLEFTGFQVMHSQEAASEKKISSQSKKLAKTDSLGWKNLAREMEKDLLSQ